MPVPEPKTPQKRSHAAIEVCDLTAEDDASPPTPPPTAPRKKARPSKSATDSPASCEQESSSAKSTSPTTAQTTPSTSSPPAVTPARNEQSSLSHIPELADRYVPKTSSLDGVEYTNPRKFCLKPAYWRKWSQKTYVDFAETLRLQFDPVPFARDHNIPVAEVQAVFSAIVCNPLYRAGAASKRGEEGIQKLIEYEKEYGTPQRPWGQPAANGSRVLGELAGVKPGAVMLVRDNGSKHEITVAELNEVDVKYLKATLVEEDLRLLWGIDECLK